MNRTKQRLRAVLARLAGGDFHSRKTARKDYFERFEKGWKTRKCTACAGSGRYDNHGSPPCGACDGTGKEKFKP